MLDKTLKEVAEQQIVIDEEKSKAAVIKVDAEAASESAGKKAAEVKIIADQGQETVMPLFRGRELPPALRPVIVIAKTRAEYVEYGTSLGDGTDIGDVSAGGGLGYQEASGTLLHALEVLCGKRKAEATAAMDGGAVPVLEVAVVQRGREPAVHGGAGRGPPGRSTSACSRRPWPRAPSSAVESSP